MKNIMLVGASSSAAQALCKNNKKYNYIKLSRNNQFSDVNNFDITNEDTYINLDLKLDGFVYFPGTINLRQFKSLKEKDFQNDFEVNVMGLIRILKYYLNHFNEGSSFVFFSTVAAKIGMPFHTSVSMVKSALNGLCISLSAEYAPKFRFNCISPSLFKSEMSSRFLRNEKYIENLREKNPLKKIGSPNDISSMIDFLLSDQSRWITAQNISVDGGMSNLKL